jgi:hypothetical protein
MIECSPWVSAECRAASCSRLAACSVSDVAGVVEAVTVAEAEAEAEDTGAAEVLTVPEHSRFPAGAVEALRARPAITPIRAIRTRSLRARLRVFLDMSDLADRLTRSSITAARLRQLRFTAVPRRQALRSGLRSQFMVDLPPEAGAVEEAILAIRDTPGIRAILAMVTAGTVPVTFVSAAGATGAGEVIGDGSTTFRRAALG